MNTLAVQNEPRAWKPRRSHPFGHLGRVRRFIAPAVVRPFAVAETVALVLVILTAACWFHPEDPLLLHAGFPWMWLVPLVVALRYGSLLGLLSGAMMLGTWALMYPHGERFPVFFFTGGLIQTVLAGHFGDTWGSRAQRAASLNDYLNDRLVALTNSHYLMRLSHERLERDLLAQPTSLRDSIAELRRLSVTTETAFAAPSKAEEGSSLRGAHSLLQFVAQACQIEVAALYPVHDGKLDGRSIAQVGDAFEFDKRDELIKRAVETMAIAHLKREDSSLPVSQYLVCAPLVSADGDLRALLVVKRMPFLALNFDNMQLLLVLLGYYADGLEHSSLVQRILEQVPGCPYEFALELSRLTRLQKRAGVASSLVALVFARDEQSNSLFEHVMRRRRSLDVIWHVDTADMSVLINLMPATDSNGVDGYLARIDANLKAQFNTDLARANVAIRSIRLDGDDAGEALSRLLSQSGLDG
ncbi:hypothetical protein EN871_32415 [bacterium M00.F.Ca.ET.228.01.1.1]|uniref:PelD GGDEF domain-containing protein n=1 Tax=Paraburkholderia phenoliruptrix TaxID=252970 RepID=UPI0010924C49|nr:PelD GGDEF domain-containing protein [Paraburkholderia phenoliruptrix]MBW9096578.1 PelD GGDEF domain-containing protein [Paraburkholderia phenoliruptrix]TGP39507.1 hypothetical protein EN871_32415 [bacterium M00.F.Ca.ET.228.01.1.1]TGR95238.1 hypothetical protein EN834_32400 [bacterium M00.F.Ca.ET.191.01.1.1]TGT96068.1 hypothetical protein EN798_32410 [bacterium M00.F.Ca.ET.155.01.1.1]